MIYRILLLFVVAPFILSAQVNHDTLRGYVTDEAGQPLSYASISLQDGSKGTFSNDSGYFEIVGLTPGEYTMVISMVGYDDQVFDVSIPRNDRELLQIALHSRAEIFEEVVVTGTLRPTTRLQSPVPVEVYKPQYFFRNPTPNMFEALQNINGVRPQLNCNVCNTGDIHINGLEGPYTMVLIDGMPIVSSLATVYGLSGIPNSLIDRIEVVKGPASSLYGSEAIGGLINVITKSPETAPKLTADYFTTSWAEHSLDLGLSTKISDKVSVLTGINAFIYDRIHDNNSDNFTDVTQQKRLSLFQSYSIRRPENRVLSLAGRYNWEDRWGGDVRWNDSFRGGEELYGEAITTNRWEFVGRYQLPTTEKLMLSVSGNGHKQESAYGSTIYDADQYIGFGQLVWEKSVHKHDLLLGTALRYSYYDDNTPATSDELRNDHDETVLPGVFIQDEYSITDKHTLLGGLRWDHNSAHGNIFTPRIAYKWAPNRNHILRFNAGSGFRVVNLFTEDHAALTGAREVVVADNLDPERSYNFNLNYLTRWSTGGGSVMSVELSSWYTYFTNQILPDYETSPTQIIYDNLNGNSISQGMSAQFSATLSNGLTAEIGATLMDVKVKDEGNISRQPLTENFSAVWSMSMPFARGNWVADYTGNLYGPMVVPLAGELDPRPDRSPWWSIQNIQLTFNGFDNFQLYGGVKNVLDFVPWRNLGFDLIPRTDDPFDQNVLFDGEGNVVPTPDNPFGLAFDPTYMYSPNQGIRGFLGVRFTLD